MGFECTRQLVARGGWKVHFLDVSEERGQEAAKTHGPSSVFHKTDVTNYSQLAATFEAVFNAEGRLDFVYANAGIKETDDLYAVATDSKPPRPLNMLTMELNIISVINQSYLASHYMQLSPHGGKGANLVMTGSAGSVYALDSAPMYAASKFGVLGFNFSIAKVFKRKFGIRVNCVLPAPVMTNLITKEEWSGFDSTLFTPPSGIVDIVLRFVDGKDMTDSNGVTYKADELQGRAAEVVQGDFYFREQHPWCNETMRRAMAANDL